MAIVWFCSSHPNFATGNAEVVVWPFTAMNSHLVARASALRINMAYHRNVVLKQKLLLD